MRCNPRWTTFAATLLALGGLAVAGSARAQAPANAGATATTVPPYTTTAPPYTTTTPPYTTATPPYTTTAPPYTVAPYGNTGTTTQPLTTAPGVPYVGNGAVTYYPQPTTYRYPTQRMGFGRRLFRGRNNNVVTYGAQYGYSPLGRGLLFRRR